jgi:EF-hand domain pair
MLDCFAMLTLCFMVEQPTDGQVAAALKEADINRDGKVSFSEFMTLMLKLKGDPNSANLLKPKMNKSAGVAATAYHTYSDEERIAFTEHINNCLAKDPHVGARLPMRVETEQVSLTLLCDHVGIFFGLQTC